MVGHPLPKGAARGCPRTAKVRRKTPEVEAVAPANNGAKRPSRHGAIRRKLSRGTECEGGSRLVERLFPVAKTAASEGGTWPTISPERIPLSEPHLGLFSTRRSTWARLLKNSVGGPLARFLKQRSAVF